VDLISRGLSLTDWYVLRIDRHAKKVAVTVFVVFLCVGVYLTLLSPRRPALVSSTAKKSDNPSGKSWIHSFLLAKGPFQLFPGPAPAYPPR